jgi:hypothetical protein
MRGDTTGGKKARPFVRPLDIAAILGVACLVVFASMATYSSRALASRIVITNGSTTWTYSLSASGRVEVPGPIGTTVVEFHGGKVHIESSPCPTQSCVQMGDIDADGQWLACLPNRVFVRIEGRDGDEEPQAGAR